MYSLDVIRINQGAVFAKFLILLYLCFHLIVMRLLQIKSLPSQVHYKKTGRPAIGFHAQIATVLTSVSNVAGLCVYCRLLN